MLRLPRSHYWPVGLMTTGASSRGEDIGPHAILTDIQGTEDHYGDMDFKVAGTAAGITAIQACFPVDVQLDPDTLFFSLLQQHL